MVDDVPSTAVCTKMQRDVTLYGVRNICDYQIIFTDFVNNYESEKDTLSSDLLERLRSLGYEFFYAKLCLCLVSIEFTAAQPMVLSR